MYPSSIPLKDTQASARTSHPPAPSKPGPVTTKLATSACPAASSQKTAFNSQRAGAPAKRLERVGVSQGGPSRRYSQHFVDSAYAVTQEDGVRSKIPQHILDEAWRSFMRSLGEGTSGLIDPSTRQRPSRPQADSQKSNRPASPKISRQNSGRKSSHGGPSIPKVGSQRSKQPASPAIPRENLNQKSSYGGSSNPTSHPKHTASKSREHRSSDHFAYDSMRQDGVSRHSSYDSMGQDSSSQDSNSTIQESTPDDTEVPPTNSSSWGSIGRSISNAIRSGTSKRFSRFVKSVNQNIEPGGEGEGDLGIMSSLADGVWVGTDMS